MADTQTHQVQLSGADTQKAQAAATQLGFPDINSLFAKFGPAIVAIIEILVKIPESGGGTSSTSPTGNRQR